MCKIKCVKHGIVSKGINFQIDKLYEVSKETYEYLLKTFPDNFIAIENCKKQKRTTNSRKKDELVVEEVIIEEHKVNE